MLLTRVLAAIALGALMSCATDPTEPLESIGAPLAAPVASEPLRLGDPIAAPAATWQYVAFPHTVCMDGKATGLAINLNPRSDRLLIYVDWSSSAAVSALTALLTPRSWGRPISTRIRWASSIATTSAIHFATGTWCSSRRAAAT